MNRRTALLLTLLALSSVALAQSQPTLSGFVLDKGSGEPLEGAEVTVVGGKSNDAVTDSDGTFILTFPSDVKPGTSIRVHIESPAPFQVQAEQGQGGIGQRNGLHGGFLPVAFYRAG